MVSAFFCKNSVYLMIYLYFCIRINKECTFVHENCSIYNYLIASIVV